MYADKPSAAAAAAAERAEASATFSPWRSPLAARGPARSRSSSGPAERTRNKAKHYPRAGSQCLHELLTLNRPQQRPAP